MSKSLVFEVALPMPYEDAMDAVESALKAEGFGIMTHVDVRATLKEKLDEEFRPYSILGACDPSLAYQLLAVEPNIGLVMPCKVTVEAADENTSIARLINPQMMVILELGDDPAIARLEQEVEEKILRVVKALKNL